MFPPKDEARRPEESKTGLADHIADSVEALAAFHDDHYRSASPQQRAIDWVTRQLGRPAAVILLVLLVSSWVAFAALAGGGKVEQPSFAWLELAATLGALIVSILILVTQRREDDLANRREQMTLELALLADKKSAKAIALLEELRRDHPDLIDRVDQESDEMAMPADPQTVLAAIDETASDSRAARTRT